MESDQEWCLECGAARTLLHRAPDWRIPLAIVGGVIALAVAGLAFALITLSSDANRSAASIVPATPGTAPPATTPAPANATPTNPATISTPTTTTAGPKPPPTHTTSTASSPNGKFIDWPLGLGGFTVALFSSPSQAAAEATASTLKAAVASVGVLNSSQHPSMTPGLWIVFAGRYRTQALAQAAATRLITAGHPQAHAELVAPTGGP